jgi:hypothetical protein
MPNQLKKSSSGIILIGWFLFSQWLPSGHKCQKIQKVIWLGTHFFWSKVCGLLGKTPYIYPRYQVWGVTDLNFDLAYYHPPLPQGGHTHEKCFRAIWGHEGPCLVMKGHFWCCFGPLWSPRVPLKRAQGGPTWHIIMLYTHGKCLGSFGVMQCHFDPFSPGPTGIKGATDQALPWKAPNDPKTLPMGILHDYMSCWTTLGPLKYPRGPQNGPKQHQNGLQWLKITRMAQNGTAWPQMTLNTSHGYITWLYVMLDHPGPFSEAHGGSIMAQNSTKNGPSWPNMALHDPKWPCMTPNGPKALLMGIIHDIMSCWKNGRFFHSAVSEIF